MRKITLIATAIATVFGVVAIAHAANTYSVSVAKVAPVKAGTATNPKPTNINFGYGVGTTDGNRPSVTTDYKIGFGPKIKNGRKYFKGNKTCTIAQAGYVSGSAPNCPATAKAGGGNIKNLAGGTTTPGQRIDCALKLTLYVGDGKAVPAAANDGIPVRNDLVLALKGVPPACPLAVDGAIPAQFGTFAGGTALIFHVKKIPFQQPTQGIDNAVVNVTSTAGKSVPVRTRVRGRTRTVVHGLFESIGCTNRAHKVTVEFKDASGAVNTATKNAPCRK